MKLLGFLFPLISLAFYAHGGGFTVRNGGGLAEFNLEYAYLKTPSLMQTCVNQSICNLSLSEKQALGKMLQIKTKNLLFADELDFSKTKSVADVAGILKWREDSTILVNLPALYPEGRALSSSEAAGMLIRLYATLVLAPELAETLAHKILLATDVASETLSMKSFGFHDNGFSFTELNEEIVFIFQDDSGAKNLTPRLEASLECPSSRQSRKLTGLENLNWQETQILSSQLLVVNASGRIFYTCVEGALLKSYVANMDLSLELRLRQGSAEDFNNGQNQVRFEAGQVNFNFHSISQK